MDPLDDVTGVLKLGDFELDLVGHKLRRQGRPVALGARAMDLLLTLAAARGGLVGRDELLRRAWPGLVVEDANLHVQVSALRKVLGSDAIATVPSVGYRLALPITHEGNLPPRHNLFAERTPFIGREAELAQAQSLLASGALLSLIGIGGTGKTRLARRLAELELRRFADGVWWVDLAALDHAEELIPAVARTLECALAGKAEPLAALARALRSQQILLVLDNCEHLIDAVCKLLDALLDAAPGLRVVVTSREALGLRGETIMPVKPLALPPPEASVEQVWASDAVRVFVQAAELACPQLEVGDEAAPAVGAICRQLDGIPLALELAASQLQVLAPEQLLELLPQRLRLTLAARRLLPRQQTLHSVIRWSVESLGDREREVLSALAVCAGGCDLQAVQAILGASAGGEQTVHSLARLADRSLVMVRHVPSAARYHLLETVRQYVVEALEGSPLEVELRDRHRDHFLGLAQTWRSQLARPDLRTRTLELLELERENMSRAIDWTVTTRRWQIGAQLVNALLPFWTARAWLTPGLALAEAVLAISKPDEDAGQANRLMISAANLSSRLGFQGRAREWSLSALGVAQRAGALELEIDALVMRTFCEILANDPGATVPDLEQLAARADQAGLVVQKSHILSVLGQARAELGELDAARQALECARQLYEEQGNPTGVASETVNLAFVAVLSADPNEARRLLRELGWRTPVFDHHAIACFTLFTLGCLARLEGQWDRCLRAHLAALRHFESGGIADSRLRRREREQDVASARRALDAATQAAMEREAASNPLGVDVAWALEAL